MTHIQTEQSWLQVQINCEKYVEIENKTLINIKL